MPETRPTLTAAASLLATLSLTGLAAGVGSDLPDDSACANINELGGLPFNDTGDTSGTDCNGAAINDDFQFSCDQGVDEAPDVFYKFTAPAEGINLYIETCGSVHDTKIYVIDDSFDLVACNDDACDLASGLPFASRLECVPLTGGATYFIGVDGFLDTSGPYMITIRESTAEECAGPTCPECPKGAEQDGLDGSAEVCGFGTMGKVNPNGGCDVDPPAFRDIACNQTICGSTYFDNDSFRDTDWFQIDTTGEPKPRVFSLTAHGESPLTVGLIAMEFGFEGSGDCTRVQGVSPFSTSTEDCAIASVTTDSLEPGVHWFFVAHSFFGDVVSCTDAEYVFTLGCEDEVCAEDIDGDGSVGFTDLLRVLSNWGPCP
ncbi:MAG: hypothetical protein HKO59_17945 [Phycisphaerales bacterium]|nr:hypothetical protein [Phycisphaerae bacterium]NNF41783.1 hypothetical protein [Phycisphaerales bacterium]NNM27823.1 hypothetical protein [Phycisphaerales bacterium]